MIANERDERAHGRMKTEWNRQYKGKKAIADILSIGQNKLTMRTLIIYPHIDVSSTSSDGEQHEKKKWTRTNDEKNSIELRISKTKDYLSVGDDRECCEIFCGWANEMEKPMYRV